MTPEEIHEALADKASDLGTLTEKADELLWNLADELAGADE